MKIKKKAIKKNQQIDKLMKQLIKLSNKSGTNISNNNINSNNKIIINAYGYENLEHITDKL